MRRLLPLLVSLPLLGCDADVSGTYTLVSVDGQELPYSFELFGTVTITSGALTLSDSVFSLTSTGVSGRDRDSESWTESGTFTLGDANIICFTTDASSPAPPPPPPPPPGDTASSTAPAVVARPPRPEPESTSECIGRWDGDQITITDAESTVVFRR
jgi:hypothetical protein